MTPAMAIEGGRSMDWFFEQFVRSTGIRPTMWNTRCVRARKVFCPRQADPEKCSGRLRPAGSCLRTSAGGKPVLLGHVVTTGEETSFQFTAAASPKKLLIDPQMTLLCLPPPHPPSPPNSS